MRCVQRGVVVPVLPSTVEDLVWDDFRFRKHEFEVFPRMPPSDIEGLQFLFAEEFPAEQEQRCIHGLMRRKHMSREEALGVHRKLVWLFMVFL